jgi:hypothetical protein
VLIEVSEFQPFSSRAGVDTGARPGVPLRPRVEELQQDNDRLRTFR